jgi:hypothetical protein
LAYRGCGHAESGGDLLKSEAVGNELLEGRELIGGMHSLADRVFSQAHFGSCGNIDMEARNREVLWNLLFLGEFKETGEPPRSGNDFEPSRWLAVLVGLRGDSEIVQQTMSKNGCGQVVNGFAACFAHVER